MVDGARPVKGPIRLPLPGHTPRPRPARGGTVAFIIWLMGFFSLSMSRRRMVLLRLRTATSCRLGRGNARTGNAVLLRSRFIENGGLDGLGTITKTAFPYPPHALLFAVPLSLLPFKLSSGCGRNFRCPGYVARNRIFRSDFRPDLVC